MSPVTCTFWQDSKEVCAQLRQPQSLLGPFCCCTLPSPTPDPILFEWVHAAHLAQIVLHHVDSRVCCNHLCTMLTPPPPPTTTRCCTPGSAEPQSAPCLCQHAAHLAQLVVGLLSADAVDHKATLGIVQQPAGAITATVAAGTTKVAATDGGFLQLLWLLLPHLQFSVVPVNC